MLFGLGITALRVHHTGRGETLHVRSAPGASAAHCNRARLSRAACSGGGGACSGRGGGVGGGYGMRSTRMRRRAGRGPQDRAQGERGHGWLTSHHTAARGTSSARRPQRCAAGWHASRALALRTRGGGESAPAATGGGAVGGEGGESATCHGERRALHNNKSNGLRATSPRFCMLGRNRRPRRVGPGARKPGSLGRPLASHWKACCCSSLPAPSCPSPSTTHPSPPP